MNSSRIRLWARLTLIANIVFTVAWIAAATWQGPHYSTVAHTISDMYADGAPGAWVLIVLFTLCGAIGIGFALRAVWPALREAGVPARVGAILLALSIFGLGDLLSPFEREGCRLADPGCTAAHQLGTSGGTMDAILSNIGVLAFVISGFFLAAAMKRRPDWRSWANPTRIVMLALIVITVLDAVFGGAGLSGFFERLVALVGAGGIIALSVGILRHSRRPVESGDRDRVTA